MLTGSKVKIDAAGEKKRTGTQAAKPLVSTYNISFIIYVVSRCSRAKKLQINVQKSVLHVQSCYCCCCCLFFFFANLTY